MIIIDGRRSSMEMGSFANLEEILVKVMEEEIHDDRIVTDVLVNDEAFSEVYPHQAEDISAGEINSVEVRTVPLNQMAADVTDELYKVIQIMSGGSRRAAELFRQGDLAEGLEVLQDLLDVTRHFLATVVVVRTHFQHEGTAGDISAVSNALDALLEEMSEVMVNQDWILLADLLEYEFIPACSKWNAVLNSMKQNAVAA
jgi:hypothetical protein